MTFRQLQGRWFDSFFQQNMTLSHPSPRKFPGFREASPVPCTSRQHPARELGCCWAAGLFQEPPSSSLSKSFYQHLAWLNLATAQPETWLRDSSCVCQWIRLPTDSPGWRVLGWCRWHLVSPLRTSGEPSGLCQVPSDARPATTSTVGSRSYLTLHHAWLIVDCSFPIHQERRKRRLHFLQNC